MKKISVLLLGLLLVACSSTKPSLTQQSNGGAGKSSAASTAATPTTAVAIDPLAENIKQMHPEYDAASIAKLAAEIHRLHNESVYFDFDKYSVKPEFRNTIEKQSKALSEHKHSSVVLEGNCDERGSAAYNMALGAKRASSVKRQLVALGVAKSKIKVVSYGNAKPKLDCHEEKCWQENRRVDFSIK